MERNRPTGRKKVVTDNSLGVHKRGEGQGTGPVGSGSRPTGGGGSGSDRGGDGGNRNAGPTRSGGGKSPLMLIIVLIVALLGGGGGLLGSGALTGGGTGASETVMESLAGNPTSASTSAWYTGANTSQMDNTVATGSRAKYTNLLGNGQDTVTIMIYLCGTDLESKSGMATRDLMEMTKANISDKVNVIVYTGGCARWQNQVLSTQTNQIYQVKSGGLQCLVQNAGSPAMTNPETLASFIQFLGLFVHGLFPDLDSVFGQLFPDGVFHLDHLGQFPLEFFIVVHELGQPFRVDPVVRPVIGQFRLFIPGLEQQPGAYRQSHEAGQEGPAEAHQQLGPCMEFLDLAVRILPLEREAGPHQMAGREDSFQFFLQFFLFHTCSLQKGRASGTSCTTLRLFCTY